MTDTAVRDPVVAPAPVPVEQPQLKQAWSLRRSLTLLVVVAGVLTITMITAGVLALADLERSRERVILTIDPAVRDATVLSAALLNQQTGIRGYVIGRAPNLLEPYTRGLQDESRATAGLARFADAPELNMRADLRAVQDAARRWREDYATPTLAAVRAGAPESAPGTQAGKVLFDQVRAALGDLESDLDAAATKSRADLHSAASTLKWMFGLIAIGLVVLLVVLAVGLRRLIAQPISRLAGEVRRVAGGDFDAELHGTGPRELVGLGADVEAMRRQIVAEFHALRDATEQLNQQTAELERSNAELEQFAYVASHDLQEPLRKVASFTQLLERRYSGQLDERADQYIAFAVDGAKRMQVLINDLLTFSRVGRLTREHAEVGVGDLVTQALTNLSLAVEETEAEITVAEDMPRVSVDVALMVGVFQNLIGNALKFRGSTPPRIAVDYADAAEEWEFAVADNGIGIEAEYADRIFVIFQRLHAKDAYPGTGIGLAMCRKIIEYHGGRIWLDTTVQAGTTFRFTLPKLPTDLEAAEAEAAAGPDGAVSPPATDEPEIDR